MYYILYIYYILYNIYIYIWPDPSTPATKSAWYRFKKKPYRFPVIQEYRLLNPYRFPLKRSCWHRFACQTPIVFQHFSKMHVFLPRGLPTPEVALPSKNIIIAGA